MCFYTHEIYHKFLYSSYLLTIFSSNDILSSSSIILDINIIYTSINYSLFNYSNQK